MRTARAAVGAALLVACVAESAAASDVELRVLSSRGSPLSASVVIGNDVRQIAPSGKVVVPATGSDIPMTLRRSVATCDNRVANLDRKVTVPAADAADGRATLTVPTLAPAIGDPAISSREQRAVGLINRLRRTQGLAAVSISPTLSAAADSHSTWSAKALAGSAPTAESRRVFSSPHAGAGCYGPAARAREAGWFADVGENVDWEAGGWPLVKTADEALDLWTRSAGHRSNLLRPEVRVIGVGFRGGFATTVLAGECPLTQWDACRTVGQGNPAAPDLAPDDPPPVGDPVLRVKFKRITSRKFRASVSMDRRAFAAGSGNLNVPGARVRFVGDDLQSGNGPRVTATFEVTVRRAGKIRVRNRYEGSMGWHDKRTSFTYDTRTGVAVER